MPVEIIGVIGVKPEGADGAAVHLIGGAVDTQWLRAFAQAHEKAGFDRVLVGDTSTSTEGFAVTGSAAAHTERPSYLIAHPPGFVAPTLTARVRGHPGRRNERPHRSAHHHRRQRCRADA